MAKAPKTANTFAAILAAVADEQATATIAEINKAFDDRATFENTLRPGSTGIQEKLKAGVKKIGTLGAARSILAANVDPNFVNRSLLEGRRFNIYAVDKIADLLLGVSQGRIHNAINSAIVKSLFKFRDAGQPFTGLAALAAASDKIKIEKGMAALLVRHTVAAATAQTQSSSTMNALLTMGAVVNVGSHKSPVWQLTTAPVVAELERIAA